MHPPPSPAIMMEWTPEIGWTWLAKVHRWNMTPYNAMIRNYAATGGPKDDHQIQKTQRHKMPASYDTFGDFMMICAIQWKALATPSL